MRGIFGSPALAARASRLTAAEPVSLWTRAERNRLGKTFRDTRSCKTAPFWPILSTLITY